MDNPFETADVVEVVGIRPIYLNKFVERRLYGIEPSARSREGRGSRRWFSLDDVFGIALVWWLFESGLRSQAIQYVLNQICGGKRKSKANDAARILIEEEAEVLGIRREPRMSSNARPYPNQEVLRVNRRGASGLIGETDRTSLLLIPVKNLFASLKESVQKLAEGS